MVGHLLHVLHVGDQHGPQPGEVGVVRVLHLHGAPRIVTGSDHLASGLHQRVGSTDSEGKARPELSHLNLVLLVLVAVHVRQLVDPDARRPELLVPLQLSFSPA